jgi:hypothetical protein
MQRDLAVQRLRRKKGRGRRARANKGDARFVARRFHPEHVGQRAIQERRLYLEI